MRTCAQVVNAQEAAGLAKAGVVFYAINISVGQFIGHTVLL
jgi:hypothetical protein